MTPSDDVVFLVDVDNTLLDNDWVERDLRQHLDHAFGVERSARYWKIFEELPSCIGLLVDGVSEVLRVGASDVEPPSATTTGNGPTAVLGVAKLGERLVLLLDLDAALGGEAMPGQPLQLEAAVA